MNLSELRARMRPEASMSAPAPAKRRSRPGRLVIAAVVVVAAAVGGLVWLLSGDEPGAVDAERALQQDQDGFTDVFGPDEDPGPADPDVDDDSAAEDPAEELEEPPEPDDLDGTWTVDTTRDFDHAAGRGTFVGYRVDEELSGIGASVAVGRSPDVTGEVVFHGPTVSTVVVEADLTTLESDEPRRDRRVRSQLGQDATARFELAEPIELPEVPPVGEVIEFTASGELTLVDVTQDVEVVIQAAVTETGLLITGSTVVVLEDYDIEVPSAPIVLSASDEATIEWQLFLVRE